jgi:hypothetical protein
MSVMSAMTLGQRLGDASRHVMVPWQECLSPALVCMEWVATTNAKRKLVWVACKQVGVYTCLSPTPSPLPHMNIRGHQHTNIDSNLSTWAYNHGHQLVLPMQGAGRIARDRLQARSPHQGQGRHLAPAEPSPHRRAGHDDNKG